MKISTRRVPHSIASAVASGSAMADPMSDKQFDKKKDEALEEDSLGSSDQLQDSDGDGHRDQDELRAGTALNSPLSFPGSTLGEVSQLGTTGWLSLDWFGTMYPGPDRWACHFLLDWIWIVAESDSEGFFFWHPSLGWHWAGLHEYPFLHRVSDGSWVYVAQEGVGGRGWFYDFELATWVSLP